MFKFIGKFQIQKAFKTTDLIKPIVNKFELNSIQPDDPRHFKLVDKLDGYESNAMSYHPRLQFVKNILFLFQQK